MKNFTSNPEAASGWLLFKRVVSATAFTTVLAIIPATMLPSTAVAGEFVEHYPAASYVAESTASVEESSVSTAEVLPESLVYAVQKLMHTPSSHFTAADQSTVWGESTSDDWQVSVSLLKTGTLATPRRWAMLRYTLAIW